MSETKPIIFTGIPDQFEDGDSFWIDIHKIRLHGIDAPEAKQTCKTEADEEIQCGQIALEFLKGLSNKGHFECHVHKGKGGKPWLMYGRYVSSCFVNGRNVGKELLSSGWAVASNKPHGDGYRNIEAQAKNKKAGLFSTEFKMPWDWRKMRRGGSECECEEGG